MERGAGRDIPGSEISTVDLGGGSSWIEMVKFTANSSSHPSRQILTYLDVSFPLRWWAEAFDKIRSDERKEKKCRTNALSRLV